MTITNYFKKNSIFGVWVCCVIIFSGCATLKNIMPLEQPSLQIKEIQFLNATFQQIDLALDIAIKNSYPFGVTLPGFDYDLQINDHSFLKGDQSLQQTIEAYDTSSIRIPLTIQFIDLYETITSLNSSDRSKFSIEGGITINAPIIGNFRIPFKKEGELPLLKMPTFKIHSLRLNKLTLSRADLSLTIKMDNPNAFFMLFKDMFYQLTINKQRWAYGSADKEVRINEKGEAVLSIPIRLNLFDMGKTVYSLLTSRKPLQYDFISHMTVQTSLPYFGELNLPLSKSGTIDLIQ